MSAPTYGQLIEQYGLAGSDSPKGVEVTKRYKDAQKRIFILNHNADDVTIQLADSTFTNLLNDESVTGMLKLKAYDVAILIESDTN